MEFNKNYENEDFDLIGDSNTQTTSTEVQPLPTPNVVPSVPTTGTTNTTSVSSTSHMATGGQFMVKTLTGKNIVVDFDPNMTVRELKEYINSSSNIPIDQQRLIFQGKQMDNDNYTIGDYNVVKDASVHLVLKLRGGVISIH